MLQYYVNRLFRLSDQPKATQVRVFNVVYDKPPVITAVSSHRPLVALYDATINMSSPDLGVCRVVHLIIDRTKERSLLFQRQVRKLCSLLIGRPKG